MAGLVPTKTPRVVKPVGAAPAAPVDPSQPGWVATSPKATTLVRCARHRDVDASVRCDRCRQLWCTWCVKSGHEQAVKWSLCDCGGRCDALDAELPPPPTVEQNVVEAFAYPLRGDGKGLLVVGALVFGGLSLVSGMASYALNILFAGYQLSWLLRIMHETANGKNDPPGFPEFVTVLDSMVVPMVKILFIVAVTIGPGALLIYLGGGFVALGVLLAVAGVYVMPMALLAIAIADSFEGFDVPRILRSIPRVGVPYAFVVALFVVIFGLLVVGSHWIGRAFIVGPLAASAFALYCVAVAGRVLGLIYAQHGKRLGWY